MRRLSPAERGHGRGELGRSLPCRTYDEGDLHEFGSPPCWAPAWRLRKTCAREARTAALYDRYGHMFGDQVLEDMAHRIVLHIQKSDIASTPLNAVIGMTTIAAASLHSPEKAEGCLTKINFSAPAHAHQRRVGHVQDRER